jgi:hypothetical protein
VTNDEQLRAIGLGMEVRARLDLRSRAEIDATVIGLSADPPGIVLRARSGVTIAIDLRAVAECDLPIVLPVGSAPAPTIPCGACGETLYQRDGGVVRAAGHCRRCGAPSLEWRCEACDARSHQRARDALEQIVKLAAVVPQNDVGPLLGAIEEIGLALDSPRLPRAADGPEPPEPRRGGLPRGAHVDVERALQRLELLAGLLVRDEHQGMQWEAIETIQRALALPTAEERLEAQIVACEARRTGGATR